MTPLDSAGHFLYKSIQKYWKNVQTKKWHNFYKNIFSKKSMEFDALYCPNGKTYFKTDYFIVKSNHFYTKNYIFKQLSIIISVQQVK